MTYRDQTIFGFVEAACNCIRPRNYKIITVLFVTVLNVINVDAPPPWVWMDNWKNSVFNSLSKHQEKDYKCEKQVQWYFIVQKCTLYIHMIIHHTYDHTYDKQYSLKNEWMMR